MAALQDHDKSEIRNLQQNILWNSKLQHFFFFFKSGFIEARCFSTCGFLVSAYSLAVVFFLCSKQHTLLRMFSDLEGSTRFAGRFLTNNSIVRESLTCTVFY